MHGLIYRIPEFHLGPEYVHCRAPDCPYESRELLCLINQGLATMYVDVRTDAYV